MVSADKTFDPATLPLPTDLLGGEDGQVNDGDFPVEHLSIIFNQKEPNQVLRLSKKATTPLWLGKRLYEKLNTEIVYKLEPIDSKELADMVKQFEEDI